jgi:hypothetical protein
MGIETSLGVDQFVIREEHRRMYVLNPLNVL